MFVQAYQPKGILSYLQICWLSEGYRPICVEIVAQHRDFNRAIDVCTVERFVI